MKEDLDKLLSKELLDVDLYILIANRALQDRKISVTSWTEEELEMCYSKAFNS
jgi:hypothetical protein